MSILGLAANTAFFLFLAVVVVGFSMLGYEIFKINNQCCICKGVLGRKKTYRVGATFDDPIELTAHDGCVAEVRKNPYNFPDQAIKNAESIFHCIKEDKESEKCWKKECEDARERIQSSLPS